MNMANPAMAAGNLLRENRYAAITSAPFDLSEVLLLSMTGVEQLSEPFRYEVNISCRKRIRNFSQTVGQPLTIGLKLDDGSTRYFNGIISRFFYLGSEERELLYRAEMVPWLSLLDHRRNSRIFQNKTSLDVIRQLFSEYAIHDVTIGCQTTLPTRSFCVQYDETDFAFISRLLEQDGVYYYFTHDSDSHTMIITDGSDHHFCSPDEIATNRNEESFGFHTDQFWKWSENVSLQPSLMVLKDYNHEKPGTPLKALAPIPSVPLGGIPTLPEDRAFDRLAFGPSGVMPGMTRVGVPGDTLESFHFPGRYTESTDGEFYAKIRAEEVGCRAYRVEIKGNVRQLRPGNFFRAANPFDITVANQAPRPEPWLALRAEIEIVSDEYKDGDKTRRLSHYRCTIEAQRRETQYRPPLRTPRPIIPGPQTAMTVGGTEGTVVTDELGRIKVQFFWDRINLAGDGRPNLANGNSSCWVRVAQNWAGKDYGGLVTPRVGQEVVVEFIGGNPDWPLVTGAVYNDANRPPETLPAKRNRSTFKTQTVGGQKTEFNELRFEDTKGEEEVYVKAQRDHNTEVLHDQSLKVGNDRKVDITANETKMVGQSYSLRANTEISLSVGANSIVINEAGIQIRSAGLLTLTSGGALTITSGVDMNVTSGAVMTLTSGVAMTLTTTALMNIIGADVNITAEDGAVVCVPFPV